MCDASCCVDEIEESKLIHIFTGKLFSVLYVRSVAHLIRIARTHRSTISIRFVMNSLIQFFMGILLIIQLHHGLCD